MNAPVTRRALLGATAAVGAVGLPTAVTAETGIPASDPDADFYALLDRFAEARAAWDATDAPLEAAMARAKDAYPAEPEPLRFRRDDFPRTSYGTAAAEPWRKDDTRWYGARGVEWLRRSRFVAQWTESCEARRREIIEAWDGWQVARDEVEDAVGLTAAARAEFDAAQTWNDADEALKLYQPRTLAGLARKATWVAMRLGQGRDDDLGEVFAHQVAAFGGVAA